MNTPKPGQVVYTTELDIHFGKITCRIKPKRFLHLLPKYKFCKDKGMRWALTVDRDNLPAGCGTAYKPEHVFATKAEAQERLHARVNDLLARIAAAYTEAIQ